MGTSCTQLHMFCVDNKSRESETSAYSNLYAFVCHFIFQPAKSDTISSDILQCAIYRYSLLVILYCITVVNIAIYRYTDILFHPCYILADFAPFNIYENMACKY